jgi:hypothetical protein
VSHSPHRFARITPSLPVADLDHLAQGWLLDGEVRQLSPQTLAARRFLVEKLIWFLKQQSASSCGTTELLAFLAYVGSREPQAGGRWGKPRQTKPGRLRTVQTHFGNLRTLFRFLMAEGTLDASPMATPRAPIVMNVNYYRSYSGYV